ncbi:phosphatidylinositol 4,5-bisphosphate 3-kinase catalytic subunit delta isoform [Adelges cooleyi]|uniref:phosphatidylinositol 4,5-bisphosphate 3-kinase catalytic subunit delta isoform n=1 Tax=Adelges cooleyi TaxID=133065 RepID=UPI00217F9156|nr:phosphatidylinositol 4,5-bisphosphate 3-kinase catalytic subunit delta isoform [Adelges cooleyi]
MVYNIPPSFDFNFWNQNSDSVVEVTCLMPNSVSIPLTVSKSTSLHELKEELWEEAVKYPLHGMLHDSSSYSIIYVNAMAQRVTLVDENKRLCDVQPFLAVLSIVERQEDKADNVLNAQISNLIGKGLMEFDSLKSSEVNQFRGKMKALADQMQADRRRQSWLERLLYQFAPRLAASTLSSNVLPATVTRRLRDDNFSVVVKFDNTETTFTFNVGLTTTPDQLMMQIINKRAMTLKTRNEKCSDFTLKVCGREEYIVGPHPLIDFAYVQDSLSQDLNPILVAASKYNVPVPEEVCVDQTDMTEQNKTRTTLTLRKKTKHKLSFDIEEKFKFKVNYISKLNCDVTRTVEVGIEAALFHGGKALCECVRTSEKVVNNGDCTWDEELVFDMTVADIPRMARLCLVVYEVSKTSKGLRTRRIKESKQEMFVTPMDWVNTTVYDFKNQLKSGSITLYMWTYADDMQNEDLLHPLGTVVSNPNIEQTTALTITFHSYQPPDHMVVYPGLEKLQEYAEKKGKDDFNDQASGDSQSLKTYLDQIKTMAERGEPLDEMHEQDRKKLWRHRYHILQSVPGLLAKLLDCVEWGIRWEVAEATTLVSKWPLLGPQQALELLDYAYADQVVRSFAVKCLQKLSDEDLSLFLLQLVQALKHESYLCCDLVEFLLTRALQNQKIGHYLFWHLRSEMQVASVSVRFGLMLEAYCRGSIEHMKTLIRQMDFLEKLKKTTELVRQRRDKEKARSFLQEYFQEAHCIEAMSTVHNPLDPSYKCKKVRTEKCRVMDSKMKPLWIVFENDDAHGDDIYVIFKNGDDLRQDMLALQMIRIMDKLWKNEGLDLRMNPYQCISTDNRVGMIEVVLNAETIANIQKEKGMFSATSAFKKGSLLAWLKDYNQTEQSLQKAIEEFTFSCAGYCVATYVLGVADRHSDNIMVKRTGQLFHIDFGHILGHFKEKFGFRRERVPFVLTHDFVHVINKGQTRKEANEFQMFQNYCEKAFLILRRHGSLILSLFAMMISTGLPELGSEKDLNYLRETLVLDLSEHDAKLHFRSKFEEALGNSWKTSLNWASHNLAKNNKQ